MRHRVRVQVWEEWLSMIFSAALEDTAMVVAFHIEVGDPAESWNFSDEIDEMGVS